MLSRRHKRSNLPLRDLKDDFSPELRPSVTLCEGGAIEHFEAEQEICVRGCPRLRAREEHTELHAATAIPMVASIKGNSAPCRERGNYTIRVEGALGEKAIPDNGIETIEGSP
jgi:hypothetical protein